MLLMRFSSFLVAAILLVLVPGICASPLSKLLPKKMVGGFRYVTYDKANEYNSVGRLTDVKPSGSQIGQGAYTFPRPTKWSGDSKCVFWFKESKFIAAPKYFVEDEKAFFNPAELLKILTAAKKDVEKTILFSKVYGYDNVPIQMLLPRYYLAASKLEPERKGGPGDLGMTIKCVPNEEELPISEDANWESYGIDGWPKGLRARDGLSPSNSSHHSTYQE
ncbi:hypothetical protein GYMLUDRAFT_260959 [Collybiopsis luxurians FD-317 M1]|uniref:Uncharacterized protein n=1 Tax=Collybiopsis luxurians FD-317 M1 TaxID=944289 RepID=A0A0D0BZZ5_9AGAR|nr:hypothetical protein GYMLUDRAFT_260959 [Collybiopsis luxurians FD-317 M1]